jgi:hypothetical protein
MISDSNLEKSGVPVRLLSSLEYTTDSIESPVCLVVGDDGLAGF